MTFTSPKNGEQQRAQGAQQAPGQIAVSRWSSRLSRSTGPCGTGTAIRPSSRCGQVLIEAAVDAHVPRRKVEQAQHQIAGLGHGGEHGAMLRIGLSAASPRECGLTSGLIGSSTRDSLSGSSGSGLPSTAAGSLTRQASGSPVAIRESSAAGRTVLAHAFKACAGAVVGQHGWRPCLRRSRPGRMRFRRRRWRRERARRRRREQRRARGGHRDWRARRRRQRRSPWALRRLRASARETAGTASQGADAKPDARRETEEREPRWGWRPRESTSGARLVWPFWHGQRTATPADEESSEGDGDHGDSNPRGLAQDHVVQREQRVGVAREEPTVLEVVAGIFGGLANVDPRRSRAAGSQ